jgi:hypothetical protein
VNQIFIIGKIVPIVYSHLQLLKAEGVGTEIIKINAGAAQYPQSVIPILMIMINLIIMDQQDPSIKTNHNIQAKAPLDKVLRPGSPPSLILPHKITTGTQISLLKD